MANLNVREKIKLEKLFLMGDGFVLGFTNNTFEHFFADYYIDIYSEKYEAKGNSKANRLREFWRLEPAHIVGKVFHGLIDFSEDQPVESYYFLSENEDESEVPLLKTKLVQFGRDVANRLGSTSLPLDNLKQATQHFDSEYIKEQIARMEKAVDSDPELAIGTAKELIETCCKTILTERGESFSSSAKMSHLSKATFKILRLAPEDIPEDARAHGTIKMLLSNLASVGNAIAELRNEYGTGHGKDGRTKGLTTRHAKVAVGAASTLVVFLYDTHKER